ncbi:Mth938-like domain-containing protein [Kordiimonas marina]|uniref:Mth938-like domain-containing protein n=1 Tax=Kordiimonas marina TaxID=2872312 RepID=UPI001FF37234|nr:Mth938-like domain-containing protein [Kordiimonas marina]MCJ9430265.1 Mth938-like domain-containing protein [Kordiimonas marina]
MTQKIQSGGITIEQQSDEDLLLIEAYGDGGFRLMGRRVEGATLVLKDGFYPVEATEVSELSAASFDRLMTQGTDETDILLIGTGEKMQLLPAAVRSHLDQNGIGFDIMDTGAAARTYNVLMLEGRRVAALLLPVA